jgi:predicted Zn-dependent protease
MRHTIIATGVVQLLGLALQIGSAPALGALQDDPKKADEPAQSESQDESAAAQEAERSQLIARRLVSAMDQLIPGDFAEDSPLPSKLEEVSLLLLRNETEPARKRLEELRAEHPELPPPPLLLAAMQFSINQGEPARLSLEQTAIEFPDYPGGYTALARLSINQQWWASARALLAQLRLKTDEGSWTEEQRRHFHLEYLDGMADVALGQRQLQEAQGILRQLAEELPDNASVPFRLADIEFRQDNADRALEYLAQARTLDKNLYPPELILHQWANNNDQPSEADRWIQLAAEKYADEISVQLEYARHLLERGNLAEAGVWVGKAEEAGASPALTRMMLGQIAFLRRSYQVAEVTFNEMLLQNPQDLAARNMLALSLVESDDPGKQQKALELASANLRGNPNNPQMASTLAWVLYRLGNVQQARQVLSQVTSLPNFPADTAYFVARMFIDQGQDENAERVLAESLKSRGLYLYRPRAEADLADVRKRLGEKKNSSPPTAGGDK